MRLRAGVIVRVYTVACTNEFGNIRGYNSPAPLHCTELTHEQYAFVVADNIATQWHEHSESPATHNAYGTHSHSSLADMNNVLLYGFY